MSGILVSNQAAPKTTKLPEISSVFFDKWLESNRLMFPSGGRGTTFIRAGHDPAEDLLRRCDAQLCRVLAAQGDSPDPEILNLQHDLSQFLHTRG